MRTLKLVNKSFAGEPEHICFQDIETTELFEFSRITNAEIEDGDVNHPIIQSIFNNGHIVDYNLEENSDVTLHLMLLDGE